MQADLMDLMKFSRYNKGYKYILNIIDIYSRFVWSFPLKTKKPDEIAPHIESVIKQIPKNHYKSIRYDQGNEFKGKVLDVMKKYDVKKFVNDPHAPNAKNSMSVVERFNYTLLQKIKKYMTKNDSVVYIDVLDGILLNYNNTVHSSIRHTPADVFSGKEYPMVQGLDLKKTDKRKFKIGDSVRAIKVRKTFDKRGFVPTFSMTVYKITDIKNNKYELSNGKSYYEEELIGAKEGEDLSEIKKKYKEAQQEEKIRQTKIREFDTEDLDKFIVEGKRIRRRIVISRNLQASWEIRQQSAKLVNC